MIIIIVIIPTPQDWVLCVPAAGTTIASMEDV